MKLTKSQLKELIKQAIVEDIMDKEIENPKTGNKIKIKTALQLPDEHPANKKAKDMVAKSPTKDDDEPMDATPAPKGKPKGPMKNPFSQESPPYEPKQKEIDKEKEQHKAFVKKVGKTPQPSDFDGDMDKYFDALNKAKTKKPTFMPETVNPGFAQNPDDLYLPKVINAPEE